MWHAGTALVVDVPIANPDAIVALASHEWERLPEVVRQASRYPGARVLLTRPAIVNQYNCHDCDARPALLARMGVASDRVVVLKMTPAQTGTNGEATVVAAYARRMHVGRVLVVTSPYHTRRSLATFRHAFGDAGVQVGVEPATATSPAIPPAWWSRPYDRWYVRHEWAATAYYAVRYGVPML
jgi:uncharacterized SAM-binding protein YcdF (DUF218 family)